jgi:hypothetical protein
MDWRWTSTVKFFCRWIRKFDSIDQRGWLTPDEAATGASIVGMDDPRLEATNTKRFWSLSQIFRLEVESQGEGFVAGS